MELQQLLIPTETKNYLTDEIYDPYSYKFNSYISYSEEELLNFTLRFQHAITLEKNLSYLQKALGEQIDQPETDQYFDRVDATCQNLIKI